MHYAMTIMTYLILRRVGVSEIEFRCPIPLPRIRFDERYRQIATGTLCCATTRKLFLKGRRHVPDSDVNRELIKYMF